MTKPEVKLIGENGNIYNLVGIAIKALRRNGMPTEAKNMQDKVLKSGSYEEALTIIHEYVDVV